ncbi:MAG: hypothetical protein HYV97_00355 [Bdellovibrio sp.]|nr:hypothetical protein [Bdellovibrio sp.]
MKKTLLVCLLIVLTFSSSVEARLSRLSRTEISQKVGCQDSICPRIVKRHLIRDLKGCQIDPKYVGTTPQLAHDAGLNEVSVHGRNAFLGLFPAPYGYRMSVTPDNGILIQANVYFTNHEELSEQTLIEMQDKLNEAAAKWTRYNPYPFSVTFQFPITKLRSDGDVKTKLLIDRYTRGPYFSLWTTHWGASTISHEMGHVMGLDDEYSNTPFPKLTYCDRRSIMCTNQRPYPYHYYLIMRRMLCSL